jgi:hypothetical protein
VKKTEAIELLQEEGWTKADATRALEGIDFKNSPDELSIRREISRFAGPELINRQRLQASQKGMVTKKTKEVEQRDKEKNSLEAETKALVSKNSELVKANDVLKKDNKQLANLVHQIKLKLAKDINKLMQYEDSEIRKALAKWFKSTQG